VDEDFKTEMEVLVDTLARDLEVQRCFKLA